MKRIVNSSADAHIRHRETLHSCPYCDHIPPKPYEWWDKNAETLVLYPAHVKVGHVALITECPKCFEKSWAHEAMHNFQPYKDYIWPVEWIRKVGEIYAKIRLDALRAWAFGLCGRCHLLDNGSVDEHAWRNCVKGSGPPQTECDRFEEVVVNSP